MTTQTQQLHDLAYESANPHGHARLQWDHRPDSVKVRVTHEPERRVARAMRPWQLILVYAGFFTLTLPAALIDAACAAAIALSVPIAGLIHAYVRSFRERDVTGDRTTLTATAAGIKVLNEDLLHDGSTRTEVGFNTAYSGQKRGDDNLFHTRHQIRDIALGPLGDGHHLAVIVDDRPVGIYLPTDASEASEIETTLREVLGLPPKT